jgi:hypothetical protein
VDDLDAAIKAGAVSALRRRADRQARLASAGTSHGDRGAIVRTGEATIAIRLAAALNQLADDLGEEATP